jgi:hypothetical protein
MFVKVKKMDFYVVEEMGIGGVGTAGKEVVGTARDAVCFLKWSVFVYTSCSATGAALGLTRHR